MDDAGNQLLTAGLANANFSYTSTTTSSYYVVVESLLNAVGTYTLSGTRTRDASSTLPPNALSTVLSTTDYNRIFANRPVDALAAVYRISTSTLNLGQDYT